MSCGPRWCGLWITWKGRYFSVKQSVQCKDHGFLLCKYALITVLLADPSTSRLGVCCFYAGTLHKKFKVMKFVCINCFIGSLEVRPKSEPPSFSGRCIDAQCDCGVSDEIISRPTLSARSKHVPHTMVGSHYCSQMGLVPCDHRFPHAHAP